MKLTTEQRYRMREAVTANGFYSDPRGQLAGMLSDALDSLDAAEKRIDELETLFSAWSAYKRYPVSEP